MNTGSAVYHTHPPAEMDAPAWNEDRLLMHLLNWHGLLIGSVGKDTVALAAIHAGEHPVQAGIQHD